MFVWQIALAFLAFCQIGRLTQHCTGPWAFTSVTYILISVAAWFSLNTAVHIHITMESEPSRGRRDLFFIVAIRDSHY